MEDTKIVVIQVSKNDLKTEDPIVSAIQRRLGSHYFINKYCYICEQKEEDWIVKYFVPLPAKAIGNITKRIRFEVEIPERFLA